MRAQMMEDAALHEQYTRVITPEPALNEETEDVCALLKECYDMRCAPSAPCLCYRLQQIFCCATCPIVCVLAGDQDFGAAPPPPGGETRRALRLTNLRSSLASCVAALSLCLFGTRTRGCPEAVWRMQRHALLKQMQGQSLLTRAVSSLQEQVALQEQRGAPGGMPKPSRGVTH